MEMLTTIAFSYIAIMAIIMFILNFSYTIMVIDSYPSSCN